MNRKYLSNWIRNILTERGFDIQDESWLDENATLYIRAVKDDVTVYWQSWYIYPDGTDGFEQKFVGQYFVVMNIYRNKHLKIGFAGLIPDALKHWKEYESTLND